MIVKPLKDKVLVAEIKKSKTSESGIILDGANSVRDSHAAKVLATGSDVNSVSVGDTVYLDWQKGQVVTLEGGQYVMISEKEIVAVLD